MAEQDTSRQTPAPYSGAKGRMQVMGQQVAGASTGSGGSGGLDTKLAPLVSGYDKAFGAETIRSEIASQLTGLHREQSSDRLGVQKEVHDSQMKLRTEPSTQDYINLAIGGVMVVEAGANAIANAKQRDVIKTRNVTIGDEEYDLEYKSKESYGVGKGARRLSNLIGKILPSVGHMREGQREADDAREQGVAYMDKGMLLQNRQIDEVMRHNLVMEAAEQDQTKTFMEAHQSNIDQGNEVLAAIKKYTDSFDFEGRSKKLVEWESQVKAFDADLRSFALPLPEKLFRKHMGFTDVHPLSPRGQADVVTRTTGSIKVLEGLIANGESYGGSYDAANKWTEGNKIIGSTPTYTSSDGVKLSEMTFGEWKERMARKPGDDEKLLAAGFHQWTNNTGTLDEAMASSGMTDDDIASPVNQHVMFDAFVKSNPKVIRFLDNPTEENLNLAHDWLSRKWLSLENSKGSGVGEEGGPNKASQSSLMVRDALLKLLEQERPGKPRQGIR